MFWRLVFLFIFFCPLTGCNKFSNKDDNNQGYADSQIMDKWKLLALTSIIPTDWDSDGNAETDIYNTWSDCEKDNFMLAAIPLFRTELNSLAIGQTVRTLCRLLYKAELSIGGSKPRASLLQSTMEIIFD